jgi:hypothetical protein
MLTKNLLKSVSALFLSVALVGCGGFSTRKGFVDPAFISYYKNFEIDELRFHGNGITHDISIKFADIKDPRGPQIAALCSDFVNPRLIEVDRLHWAGLSETSRKVLIYHELGHCELDLDHTTDLTIMNQYLMNDTYFNSDPEGFISLLFLQGK